MKKRLLSIVLCLILVASCVAALTACSGNKNKVIMIWGPEEHRDLYVAWAKEFRDQHADVFEGYEFDYAGSGDSGAYGNMKVDPTNGAAIYTFANDQMANLANLGALSPLTDADVTWARENNIESAVESTKMGSTYMAYPLQADNGYYLYYNKDAFRGTSIWDATNDCIKEDFTFREMYAALDERAVAEGGSKWANGKITWALGDSWYVSGAFFAVGGDYDVQYDEDGKQVSATCSFGYTLPEGETSYKNGDYSLGFAAVECLVNSFTNTDGTVNKHYYYTDGDKAPLNDYISLHINENNNAAQDEPLAAAVCGTWKANEIQTYWGDNYAATWLPMLEDNSGNRYAFKNFAGYKNLGVNPLCEFATANDTNIEILHEMAKFLTSKEAQLQRYQKTGAGPSNKEALQDSAVAADVALLALNKQYDRVCTYPAGTTRKDADGNSLAGKPIGNGLGFRVQDSVPANYWTPIQNFGNKLWQEYNAFTTSGTALDNFAPGSDELKRQLAQLQTDISQAAQ